MRLLLASQSAVYKKLQRKLPHHNADWVDGLFLICINYHAFPAEPKRCIFSATTAFMASFADAIT